MKKAFIIALITILAVIGLFFWYKASFTPSKQPTSPVNTQDDKTAKIISTKPDPLENTIISASEQVEITFNKPLENVGEFKVRIEPKTDFKLELSPDRKTGKIIPNEPYALGTTYTLFIGPDTKFDGVGAWGQEKIYHFKTITYKGV